jgi:hypothetical protein
MGDLHSDISDKSMKLQKSKPVKPGPRLAQEGPSGRSLQGNQAGVAGGYEASVGNSALFHEVNS